MLIRRKVGPRGQVVIPKDLREHLGLRSESLVTFEVKGDEVILRVDKSPEELVEDYVSIVKEKLKREVDLEAVLEEEVAEKIGLRG